MRKFRRKIKVKISEDARKEVHHNLVTVLDENIVTNDNKDTCMVLSILEVIESKFYRKVSSIKRGGNYNISMRYHEAIAVMNFFQFLLDAGMPKWLYAELLELVGSIDKQIK